MDDTPAVGTDTETVTGTGTGTGEAPAAAAPSQPGLAGRSEPGPSAGTAPPSGAVGPAATPPVPAGRDIIPAEATLSPDTFATEIDGIARAIDAMSTRLARYRSEAEAGAAAAFGDAARRCLPQFARSAVADEIAAAGMALAAEIPDGTIELRVPPMLVRPLAEALERHLPETPCVIAGDPGLSTGSAEITWRVAGTRLDPERLADSAMTIMTAQLAARQTRKEAE
ncbi:MAG: hypothetical protein AAFV86_00070 [Pseudomonadota bacterium]